MGEEEEKVEGTMGEEQVEKAVVEGVLMEYLPFVAPLEVSEAPGASALEGEHEESSHSQAELALGTNSNPNIQQQIGPPSPLLRLTPHCSSNCRRSGDHRPGQRTG